MFSSFLSPTFRSPYLYQNIGFGGFNPGFGFGFGGINQNIGYGGFGGWGGINSIGSAISNQSLINTGSAIGITQTSTPTVIF